MLRKIGSERTEQLAREVEELGLQVREIPQGTEIERGWSHAMGRVVDAYSAEEMRSTAEHCRRCNRVRLNAHKGGGKAESMKVNPC